VNLPGAALPFQKSGTKKLAADLLFARMTTCRPARVRATIETNLLMTTAASDKPTRPTPAARRRDWAPRIWEGCDFFAWLNLLFRNRFAVHWSCLYIAIVVTMVSAFHTVLRYLQQIFYGADVARTPLRTPLFILGHWRTGTTLLHEFLIQDERHTYPNTYECLEPNHFLLTEAFITRWLRFLMPSRRPMDNMAAGWEKPQEDEFALCMLGTPSPYLMIAFPNRPPLYPEYLDLQGVPPRALDWWKKALVRFLRHLSYKDPRRLVLKSPPHTCRIDVLLQLFPDAQFVHIVRDPYVVFPSTVNLWKTLYRKHGLQPPTCAGLEELVFSTFNRVYAGLERGRKLVDPARFYELRYEDLVQDPVGELLKLYEHLHLGGFEEFLPRLQVYLATIRGYETNRYQLSPELRAEITRRWERVIRQFGYDERESTNETPSVGERAVVHV
jgi:hypothetical protein